DERLVSCIITFGGFEYETLVFDAVRIDSQPATERCRYGRTAVDLVGNVYANSEDGSLYVLRQGGGLVGRIFLNQALGAAYTPLSLGPDGKIYTENDGILFSVGQH